MKISISRQSIYLLSLSIFLLIFVLIFSFSVLIPKGKEYREQRNLLNKDRMEVRRYEDFSISTLDKLKELQSENAHSITAFDNSFNSERFEKQHSLHFTTLKLSKKKPLENEDEFAVYEVNTTSSINSPQSFYAFLDSINKGDWVIGINFPINFKRDHELITSSFTMRVYSTQKASVK
ncbi:hypothetical protein [Sulfurimonas sp.]|uniref:hypothetical protein n=1 Tax=Sulfurimonas sp. TaxID=2022749 RepID=UPI0025FBF3EE|nr:hypothetical protein [Sulfurimonas sp.]